MKKLISVFISLIMIVLILSPCASAFDLTPKEYPTSGVIGNNIRWNISESGTLTITGTGAIPDYSPSKYDMDHSTCPPWHPHYTKINEVIISDGITTLGSKMFYGCSSIDVVKIPNSLEKINGSADFCYAVETVSVPSDSPYFTVEEGVLYDKNKTEIIFLSADRNASNRYYFNVPETVNTIRSGAFYRKGSLKEITIMPTVTTIEENAFPNMHEVTFIVISGSAAHTAVQNSDGALTAQVLPDNTLIAGTLHYQDDAYISYVLEDDGVLSIKGHGSSYYSDDKFLNSSLPWRTYIDKVKTVYIEEGIKTLPNYLFKNTPNLEVIHIPQSLINLGEGATYGCTSLREFTVAGDEINNYFAVDGILYDENSDEPVVVRFPPAKEVTSYTFSEGVYNFIGDCFKDCTNLKTVTLNNGDINHNVFFECENLEALYISDSNCDFSSPDGVIYNTKTDSLVFYPRNKPGEEYTVPIFLPEIGQGAFSGAKNLKKVILQTGLQTIDKSAFAGSSIETVTIPGSVTEIGDYSFSGCNSLSEVIIESSGNPMEIKTQAFGHCIALKSIEIPGRVKKIWSWAFENCTALESAILHNGVETLKENIFNKCTSLKSVSIPGTVESLPDGIFYSLTNLENITLGEGIKTIGEQAFYGCAIKQITLPDSVTSLGDHTFSLCHSLTRVNFPASLSHLPNYMFEMCTSLKSITVPSHIKTTGYSVFYSCRGLESVIIKAPLTSISDYMFSGCSSLKTVTVPDTVTTISSGAFYNCDSFEGFIITEGMSANSEAALQPVRLEIPLQITSLGKNAFAQCDGIETIVIPGSIKTFNASAFTECTNLKEIIIEDGAEVITGTFKDCESIEKIHIPSSVTSISESLIPLKSEVTIYAEKGSYAEEYATLYGVSISFPKTVTIRIPENCSIDEQATAFVVIYGRDGVITDIKCIPLNLADSEVTLQTKNDSQAVKMFIWKNEASIIPVLQTPVEQLLQQ